MKLKFVIVFIAILSVAGCIENGGIQIDNNTTGNTTGADIGIQIDKIAGEETSIDKNNTGDVGTLEIDKNNTGKETGKVDDIQGTSSGFDDTAINITDTPIMIAKTVGWCKTGESIEQKTGMSGLMFKIKGLAIFQGKESCMAESPTDDNFKFVYYFDENRSYEKFLAVNPDGSTYEISYT